MGSSDLSSWGAYDKDGKGPSIWDEFSEIPGKTYKNTNGKIAVIFIIDLKKMLL